MDSANIKAEMEVALSAATLTVGNLTPIHSQDAVIIHAPRRRCTAWTEWDESPDQQVKKKKRRKQNFVF